MKNASHLPSPKPFLFALLLSFLMLAPGEGRGQCTPAQRQLDSLQLVVFYIATNGTGWNNDDNWLSALPIENWNGIGTDQGCVYIIDLSGNNLTDTLPNFYLPNLNYLDLSGNQLSGNIPNFNLPNLDHLYLNNNDLSGSIPIFNFLNLTTCNLYSNQLSGNIPNFNMPNLIDFYLHTNQLSGCYPANSFCGTNYDFTNNPLLPWEGDYSQYCNGEPQIGSPCDNTDTPGSDEILSDCTCGTPICTHPDKPALMELYYDTQGWNWANKWTDTTSCDVCSWYGVTCNASDRVIILNLNNNNLVGSLPYLDLFNLQALVLSSNQLDGNIPNFTLPNLISLNLEFNLLDGNIPNFTLPNLVYLYLFNNMLDGNIPNFTLLNLEGLNLDHNQLDGNIPNFNNLPNLFSLWLHNNQLSGNIPNFNLPNLQGLRLNNNQLSGCYPTNSFCGIGYYDFMNNPLLPWEGDYSHFCNGEPQITAFCDNPDTPGSDVIQSDCTCGEPCQPFDASLSSDQTICPNQSATLTFNFSAGTSNYDVIYNDGSTNITLNSIPNGHTINVNPSSTTTYTIISATDADGCDATIGSGATITVAPKPAPNAITTTTSPLCAGADIELTETTGQPSDLFDWSNGATTQTITLSGLAAGNHTYTVTVTNSDGCTGTDNVSFTVLPKPDIAATIAPPADDTPCEGSSLTFVANSTPTLNNWQWFDPNGNPLGNASTQNLNNIQQGEEGFYSVIGTAANGCPDTATVEIEDVFALPDAEIEPINPSGNPNFCENDDLELADLGCPNCDVWEWRRNNVIIGNGENITVSPAESGIYTLKVTDLNQCAATDQIQITVHALPTPTAGNNSPICEGLTLQLSGSSCNGCEWLWQSPDGSQFAEQNPEFLEVPEAANGTFFITVTDANQCTAETETEVEIFKKPELSPAAFQTPACEGDDISLEANSDGAEFLWRDPAGNWLSDEDNYLLENVTLGMAGFYKITATSDPDENCSITDSILIEINQKPNIVATWNNPICPGDSLKLKAIISGNYNPNSLTWTGPGNWTVVGFEETFRFPAVPGTYIVSVTDDAGGFCTAADTITVAVGNGSVANISAPPGVCTGENLLLSTSGGQSFQWIGPNFMSTAQNPVVANPIAGVYAVTVTGAGGCTSTASATVAVWPKPSLSNPQTTNVLCFGEATGAASITASGGTPNYIFLWSGGAIGNDSMVNNLPAGSYTVSVSDGNGCTATFANSLIVNQPTALLLSTMQQNPAPNGSATVQIGGGVAPFSINWNPGNDSLTNLPAGDTTISSLSANNYTLVLTDANGCTATTTFVISGNPPPGCTLAGASFLTKKPSCAGVSDGELTLNFSGGAAPFNFNWAAPPTAQLPLQGVGGAVFQNLPAGNYTVIITDANNCTATATTNIADGNAPTTPIFDAPLPLCQFVAPPVLPDTSNNNFSGNWSPANISTAAAGVFTFNFLPNPGQCAAPTTLQITVSAPEIPVFDALPTLCQNAAPPVLPDTSNNNFTGNWSPATISTAVAGDFTFNFLPNPGQCASDTTLQITVNELPDASIQTPLPQITCSMPTVILDGFSTAPNADFSWSGAGGFTRPSKIRRSARPEIINSWSPTRTAARLSPPRLSKKVPMCRMCKSPCHRAGRGSIAKLR